MKTTQKALFIISLISSFSLYAKEYIDMDIDGVDDSIDRCLDTPFDEVVDDNGCSISQLEANSDGEDRFLIELGLETSFNDINKNSSNISIYSDYIYKNWDFSLSTNSYTNSELSNTKDGELGDLYLGIGYILEGNDYDTKLSLGAKVSINDDVGTGENDYFSSIFFDYFLDDKQDLFLYYSYTISGDSREVDYEDFSSISIGSGYAITQNWYSSLSYDFSESNYKGDDNYQAISWLNSYNFSKSYYMSFNYITGLDELSYDHTISLRLGVNFD